MPPTPLRDVKRRGISLTRSIDGGEVRVVKKRVRGVPLRWRPPRGPKVMLSVVLGRATRACVIHITGITEKELPAAAIRASALTVFVTRAGKASRSDQSTI